MIHTTISQSQQQMCQTVAGNHMSYKTKLKKTKQKKNLKGQALQHRLPLTLAFDFSEMMSLKKTVALGSH